MKKVWLSALILATAAPGSLYAETCALPPGACPKAFEGAHIGGNIAYGVGSGKTDLIIGCGASEWTPPRKSVGFRGVDGGIGTGYLFRLGHWGLGAAFDANWANTKGRAHTLNLKVRLRNSLQLYGKAGYVICEKVMPFLALGWDNSRWNFDITENECSGKASLKKRLNGLLWKAGVDFLGTRHFVFGLEYTGTYAKKSYKVEGTTSWKPQYNRFALTARFVY